VAQPASATAVMALINNGSFVKIFVCLFMSSFLAAWIKIFRLFEALF